MGWFYISFAKKLNDYTNNLFVKEVFIVLSLRNNNVITLFDSENDSELL
jgi:hypothetical protein